MCAALEINQHIYYKEKEDKNYYDYLIIKEIFNKLKGTYRYRRICEDLKIKYGVIFNHKKVQRIMNKYHSKPEYAKKTSQNNYKRIEANVKSDVLTNNSKLIKKSNTVQRYYLFNIWKQKMLFIYDYRFIW